jgi:hypothetical protein
MPYATVGFFTDKKKKVHPIRRPYGLPRYTAKTIVDRMRARGERVRLIRTNEKHKLYAPYKSVLTEEEGYEHEIKQKHLEKLLQSVAVPVSEKEQTPEKHVKELLKEIEEKEKHAIEKAKKEGVILDVYEDGKHFKYLVPPSHPYAKAEIRKMELAHESRKAKDEEKQRIDEEYKKVAKTASKEREKAEEEAKKGKFKLVEETKMKSVAELLEVFEPKKKKEEAKAAT